MKDAVLDEARSMRTRASKLDGDTLDQYFTSVRETEQSLAKSQAWEMNPKPHVDVPRPKDITNTRDIIERARLMFDMTHLALQSDSTRLITIAISGMNAIPHIQGVTQDYHSLSHHGQDPERLSELKIIELEQLKLVAQFLGKLRGTVERDKTLLNQTMVMMGSELGNANSHDNHNLPILLAGGGFRHGQHLAFDPNRNCPLANLFVSMLQQLGLPIEKFASSTGTMSGLNT